MAITPAQDEYDGIIGVLKRLNATQRTVSVDGPGLCRCSSWTLFDPALCMKVTRDDAGAVTVLVNGVQAMSVNAVPRDSTRCVKNEGDGTAARLKVGTRGLCPLRPGWPDVTPMPRIVSCRLDRGASVGYELYRHVALVQLADRPE